MGKPTVNVLTVHHYDARWIDLQLRQLKRHLAQPYKVWAVLEGVSKEHHEKFDEVVPAIGRHEGKLNLLAAEASAQASAEELLMFLDGDAFLVADPWPVCEELLQAHQLLAVQRYENSGDRQPHPCFAVMRVATWEALPGDWSMGHPWLGSGGELVSDVGANMLWLLERKGRSWAPLLRSNKRNLHPLWFGLYADLVYHHGAGFRLPFSRLDKESIRVPTRWQNGNPIQRATYRGARRIRAYRGRRLVEGVAKLLESDFSKTIDFLRGEGYVLEDPVFRSKLRRVCGSPGVIPHEGN